MHFWSFSSYANKGFYLTMDSFSTRVHPLSFGLLFCISVNMKVLIISDLIKDLLQADLTILGVICESIGVDFCPYFSQVDYRWQLLAPSCPNSRTKGRYRTCVTTSSPVSVILPSRLTALSRHYCSFKRAG